MEKFTDIKLKSFSIKKEYYPEKGYVKCPDCPKLLHCGYCVQHLRNQNPHHWVGISVNEVSGCQGCQERYQRGIVEAENEAVWLRKKLNILEMRLTSHAEDLKEAHELADGKLIAQQLAYEGAESVMEMNLRAQIEDLSKTNEDAENIVGMKLRLELEAMKEAYGSAESRVTFLKRRPPDLAVAATPAGGLGSTLPILGDVTFIVQGQDIHAHQLILGYKSMVFRKIFEELHLELSWYIPESLKQVETAPIPPIPPPPPPPPPPPLPQPPDERFEEKCRKKRERINPVVKVRLVSSSMLEQMGLRGVRCHLSVVTAQSLVGDAAYQTLVPQLMQDMSRRENGEKVEIRSSIDGGEELQSGRRISPTSFSSAPLVFPTVNSSQPQIATPGPTHQLASGVPPATSLPILQCQGPKKENNKRESSQNVAFQFNEQERAMVMPNLFQTLQTARPAATKAVIEVHNISYAVMRAVIDCCYTAHVDFTEEVSPGEVLKVAHKYDIDYLRDLCEQELCKRLSAGNVAEMLKLGRKFGAKRLHTKATQLFRDNFDDVQESVLNSCC